MHCQRRKSQLHVSTMYHIYDPQAECMIWVSQNKPCILRRVHSDWHTLVATINSLLSHSYVFEPLHACVIFARTCATFTDVAFIDASCQVRSFGVTVVKTVVHPPCRHWRVLLLILQLQCVANTKNSMKTDTHAHSAAWFTRSLRTVF